MRSRRRSAFRTREIPLRQISCHIARTTPETLRLIRENAHRSPMYTGQIEAVGPRYCPSIEDKIVRFPDKAGHQFFLEPEGLNTHEVYINGMSTSPADGGAGGDGAVDSGAGAGGDAAAGVCDRV